MKELAGRLSSLDPQASESLKVIAYFDTLVHGRVGIEGMLRGAAVLCGAPVGHQASSADHGTVYEPAGGAPRGGTAGGWPTADADDGSVVWVERSGPAHANDEMVLERLALAISVTTLRLDAQGPMRGAVETLLSDESTREQRESAAARLSLRSHATIHAIAVPAHVPLNTSAPHATIASTHGIVRGVLSPTPETPAGRAGIGIAAHSADGIRESWRTALIALRLTDTSNPIVNAADLGLLVDIAEIDTHRSVPHADVVAIDNLSSGPWNQRMLDALVTGASQRALASIAGVHHSTMAARLEALPALLGYDPSTPWGHARLTTALMLHRLRANGSD